jgi:hypothetical protein
VYVCQTSRQFGGTLITDRQISNRRHELKGRIGDLCVRACVRRSACVLRLCR